MGSAVRDIIDGNRHLRQMSFVAIRELIRFNQLLDAAEPVPAWPLLRSVSRSKGPTAPATHSPPLAGSTTG